MRSYECTIALHPDLGEAGIQEQVERVRSIVDSNEGSVKQIAEWGLRDLAYPIRKERRAVFQIVVFEGTGATVAELERNLRISEQVLRYITVRIDPDRPPVEIGRSRRSGDEDDASDDERSSAAASGDAESAS